MTFAGAVSYTHLDVYKRQIVGNMDSQIFLGGSEPTTLKDLSEMLGKETICLLYTSRCV